MASAWNVVRAQNYNAVSELENCESPANSPVPDKFKKKFTVNSLRMSIRKRIPLKRIIVNGTAQDYYHNEARKQKVENPKGNEAKINKTRGIAVETSMKKSFYRMTEQLTGAMKKQHLKETPQSSSPRTRYRERLTSPPDTPSSPANGFNSPCGSTPLAQVKSLKRYTGTPYGAKSSRSSTAKGAQRKRRTDSDDFSSHLELISCGIQHLESNGNKMLKAISNIGLDYESSPLQTKIKGSGRLWKDEIRSYTPLSPQNGSSAAGANTDNNDHSQSSFARGMLRRTMTRMSLRVNKRPPLRSTKSASNIKHMCYNGPMAGGPRKLAPLREKSAPCKEVN